MKRDDWMRVRRLYINKIHVIMEILSYVILLICFAVTIYSISISPAKVPTHYDFEGNVDGYGSPYSYLFLPTIMLFANITVSLIMHFVDAKNWNMPFTINAGRELVVYRDISYMFVAMEVLFSCFTLASSISNLYLEYSGKITLIASVVMTILLFVVIIIPAIFAYRHNKI